MYTCPLSMLSGRPTECRGSAADKPATHNAPCRICLADVVDALAQDYNDRATATTDLSDQLFSIIQERRDIPDPLGFEGALYPIAQALNGISYIIKADGYSPADAIADSIGNVSESLDGLADAVGDLKKVDASPKGASRRSRR